jgi:hypothetical protein
MVASGSAKSTAAAVLDAGVPENWMPALCGSVAACVFIFFVTLLDTIPDPSESDRKVRSERRTMTPAEAKKFLLKWAPGLGTVTLVYACLTAFRNFRDFFAPELWRDLDGANFNPSRFTETEIPVGICTAVAYSLLYWMKDNKKAFFAILGTMFLGGFTIMVATFIHSSGLIDPLPWMVMIGVGLYMAYIPPGAMLYDRFNGATGQPFTSVFMIYLSDVVGYTGTLSILFYKTFGDPDLRYVDFFHKLSFIAACACMFGMVVAAIYFAIAMRNLVPANATAHIPLKEVVTSSVDSKEEEEVEVNNEKKLDAEKRTISFEVSVDREFDKVDLMDEQVGTVNITAQAVYA